MMINKVIPSRFANRKQNRKNKIHVSCCYDILMPLIVTITFEISTSDVYAFIY